MYVFFCHALYIQKSGPFQNGAKPLGPEPFVSEPVESLQVERHKAELLEAEGHRVLVFYCSLHLHLFETALNGPLFWAFDKQKDFTSESKI